MIFASISEGEGGRQSALKAPLSILMKPPEISILFWGIVGDGVCRSTDEFCCVADKLLFDQIVHS